MPIDANILLQQQPIQLANPLAQAGQIAQIQGAQQQNRLAQLQFDQAQRTEQQQIGLGNAFKDAYDPATRKVDSSKLVGLLATGGYGAAIPTVQKGLAETAKAQAEAQQLELKGHAQKLELVGQVMGAVKDQPSYDAAVAYLKSHIPDGGADLPPVYDPATVQATVQRALTTQQQVEKLQKDLDYKLGIRKQDEVERDNKTKNDISKGQLGVAQGNLGVARSRLAFDQAQPKGVYDKDNGIIVDPRTGRSIAVSGPDGQPLAGGGGKLTEDQGKATGWLIQAENAFKNMNAAVKSTPSAVKPGINDAIAAIPSFGVGEAVANNLRGGDRQRFLQGASSLSEALLRAATGAGVNESEARQKVAELTPVSGDTDANIAQKMASIPLYIDSLKVRAGPGAKKAADVLSRQPAKANPSSDGWTVTEVK